MPSDGTVTTGTTWKFLKLMDNSAFIDPNPTFAL